MFTNFLPLPEGDSSTYLKLMQINFVKNRTPLFR
jgi:hypothetical protein